MPPDDIRKAVKHRLVDMDKTQAWLCAEVTARTGRYCDRATLRRVLMGKTKRTPIAAAVRQILNLPEE